MLPTRSAKPFTENSGRRTEACLRRIGLFGIAPATVRALGQLLGRRFYLLVTKTEAGLLSLARSPESIDALVIDTNLCGDDTARLIKLVRWVGSQRSSDFRLPVFAFGVAYGDGLGNGLADLELEGIFKKPGDIWKLAEAILKEVDGGGAAAGNEHFGTGPEAITIEALKYIDENLANIRSSTEVSRHLGVTREHLSRQFTKYAGQTLWNFIITSRVQRAMEMLREGKSLVKQISRETGFNCESSFFRAFVKKTGVTPERFRKTLRDR